MPTHTKVFSTAFPVIITFSADGDEPSLKAQDAVDFCTNRYGLDADGYFSGDNYIIRDDRCWDFFYFGNSIFFGFKESVPDYEVIEFKMRFG